MIIAILQARMSSSRTPGKVLRPILGQPMILRHLERLKRAATLDRIVVATSIGSDDDAIEEVASGAGFDVFRGSLDDVLDRYVQAARRYVPDHVVRVTADCPLADWTLLDRIVRTHLASEADYTSNTLPLTWPNGLNVEVVRTDALERAWRDSSAPYDREHVTPYVKREDGFRRTAVLRAPDLSQLRWTVDYPDDFAMVEQAYNALYPTKPDFDGDDLHAFFRDHPEVLRINNAPDQVDLFLKRW